MHPQRPLREAERENYAFFLDLPEVDRTKVKIDVKGAQFLQPLFEYSGRLRRAAARRRTSSCSRSSSATARSSPTRPAARRSTAATCRPRPTRSNADGRGPAWSNSLFEDNAEFGFGFRLALDKHAEQAAELLKVLALAAGRHAGRRPPRRRPVDRGGHRRAARARGRAREQTLAGIDTPRGAPAGAARRLPGPQERLDRRRRRLGLRHRLRRPRPRAGHGPRREHPRARHRGVLEHRRPGVEGHAARRVGQVRDGRQGDRQEGPRPDGHDLRQRLRRARRLRREGRADGEGLPGGRGVPGPVDHHRLQPLHRPRLRPGEGPRPAEAGGRHRLLAALPLRPAARGDRREPARARFAGTQDRPGQVHRRTRRASGSSSRWIPRGSRCCRSRPSRKSRGASASTSSWRRWRSP